jgi:hypothetical protein
MLEENDSWVATRQIYIQEQYNLAYSPKIKPTCVGMWCSFVIIHVVMIRKRWQPARQQLLRGITSLATLCIYRP